MFLQNSHDNNRIKEENLKKKNIKQNYVKHIVKQENVLMEENVDLLMAKKNFF